MPARDPAVWREEILRAMNEPRKRLGREISAKLKEVYDWDAVAASVVGEYAKVLQP